MANSYNIGIVTFWNSDNFGALLQNWALQEVLKSMGHRPKTVKYAPARYLPSSKSLREKTIGVIRDPKKILAFFNELCWRLVGNPLKIMKAKRFQEFRENYINYSDSVGRFEDVTKIAACDFYICGSDQIWNPHFINTQEARDFYFLAFCEPWQRICYAPSVAVDEIPFEFQAYYKQNLLQFNSLSVREKGSSDLIESVCGLKAKVVLDPTLLLSPDEWRLVASRPQKRKYVLGYFLGMTDFAKESLSNYAQKNDLEVILLKYDHEVEYFWCRRSDAISVNDFLGLIDNAETVFTDSFHGVVFSIIFGKSFYVFPRSTLVAKNMSSRIIDLLEKLGLMQCYLREPEFEGVKNGIDYVSVYERLNRLKYFSLCYLRESICSAIKSGNSK